MDAWTEGRTKTQETKSRSKTMSPTGVTQYSQLSPAYLQELWKIRKEGRHDISNNSHKSKKKKRK